MVWYSQLFKGFPQIVMIHTVKRFSVDNETEVNTFLEFPCFLYDPVNVGSLISGSSVFPKPSLNIWKFSVHVLLKSSLEDFEHNFTSMGGECNCPMVWTLLSTVLFGNWDEDWPFPVLWPLLCFPNLLTYWIASSFTILSISAWIPSPSLALLASFCCCCCCC